MTYIMRNFVNTLSFAFLIILFNVGAVLTIAQSSDELPLLPWDGKKVFTEKGCIQCHAIYGKGGDIGTDLGEDKFYGSYLDLAALMWNHFPDMYEEIKTNKYKFPEFTAYDMKQLVAYLFYSRFLATPASNEFRSRKVLRSKGCFDCHKFGGEGGDIGPDFSSTDIYLTPVAVAELMWNHGPAMMDIFRKNEIDRPEIDDDEIDDLISGILSYIRPTKIPADSDYMGNPLKGEKLSETKGCMKCHSFNGVGETIGPDFDEVDFNYSVTQIAAKMWNHGPHMWEIMEEEGISFPVFETGEMADIIAYMYYLNLEDKPGDKESGEQIIKERGCLSCHSIEGEGSDIALDFTSLPKMNSSLDLVIDMWNHAPKISEKLTTKNIDWPELTSKEMADIHEFLNSVNK